MTLYRTTIVIWTDYDPAPYDIDVLAREAMEGDAYCESSKSEAVTDATQFPPTDFFTPA